MPPPFRFPGEDVELWAPLGNQLRGTSRESRFMLTVARLDPGVTLESAHQEMALISERLADAYPDENAGWRVSVMSAHATIVGDVRPVLLALLGGVSFVLLIACGNVANLRVYPGFPTLFWGLSGFCVGDLMGKALWKLVENAARFPRRGGRVLCVHGAVSFHRARPCGPRWLPGRGAMRHVELDRRVLGLQSTGE